MSSEAIVGAYHLIDAEPRATEMGYKSWPASSSLFHGVAYLGPTLDFFVYF